MYKPDEIWQVEVKGEIYETTFAEMTQWIAENSLLESDKVRRGKLRWLEAGKVPTLREFFNAKELGIDPPQIQITTNSGEENQNVENEYDQVENSINNLSENQFSTNITDSQSFASETETQNFQPNIPDQNFCNIHPDVPSEFICEACSHAFCVDCPQRFGSSVRTCPYCGAMCSELNKFRETQEKEFKFRSDMAGGFGFDDFGKALVYPFKFKVSLFFGGLLLAIFNFGQSAASFGIFFAAAALICLLFANAITFGVLANTIENFSQGYTDRDFMPSFDEFSLWDDIVHPFFLSIAVWISSFGVFAVLVFGIVWYAWSSFTSQMMQPQQNPYAQVQNTQQTSKHVKDLIEKFKKQNQGRPGVTVGEDGLTEGQRENLLEEAEFQNINEMAKDYKKAQLESAIGQSPETQQKAMQDMVTQFIKGAGVFIIFAGLAALWGLFYFPAACAVAGYTRSFAATINPLVGLDTIKHLGLDYLKILLMSILLSIMSGMIGMILSLIFSPFNMPTVGNIPAKFIGSFVTFFFTVSFAVTLGYALYKNTEKLNLYRG